MNLDQDHIHLLISIPVEYSIDQTVSRLKQMTTNYLYREKNDYMRNFIGRIELFGRMDIFVLLLVI